MLFSIASVTESVRYVGLCTSDYTTPSGHDIGYNEQPQWII